MKNIIIYNNTTGIAKTLVPFLMKEDICALVATCEEDFMKMIEEAEPGLVLLDIELEAKGWCRGIQTIKKVRECSYVPMIVVSKDATESEKIVALESGADDYVDSSCNPMELVARIKSQLRRYMQLVTMSGCIEKVYSYGGLVIDDVKHAITVDGKNVKLTPSEYKILKLLVQKKGTVLSNLEIYENIWKMNPIGAENTIAVHVRHIREKIESNPAKPQYLKGVWGNGYMVG